MLCSYNLNKTLDISIYTNDYFYLQTIYYQSKYTMEWENLIKLENK